MTTEVEVLTTEQALSELSAFSPFVTYHALEVAARDLWRFHSHALPSHYTSRDFLEWAFGAGVITRSKAGFVLSTVVPKPTSA